MTTRITSICSVDGIEDANKTDCGNIIIHSKTEILSKVEERSHILKGFIIIADALLETRDILSSANSEQEGRENLMVRFNLDDIQARAIIHLTLRTFAGLDSDKLHAEFNELQQLITHFNQTTPQTGDFIELYDNGKEWLVETTNGLFYSKNNGKTWHLKKYNKKRK
ncbi:MAG: hypothetical protein K2H97_07025 [Prevotella sp.]|nr:hypothetical protein [Prevotella sp.]